MKDQCCPFELAKRLKELGVKQESYFDWYSVKGNREKDIYVSDDDAGYGYKLCSAFTVAELGEALKDQCSLPQWNPNTKIWIWDSEGIWEVEEKTEASARAAMLIYLIENKLVKP